eukprot:gnl/Spiro4/13403_TR7145_c0_g1_i1.p2 gnl/Spiro4/13403_TR7145_c0_g1~~gnl/Spiro4/13403_TR7145_c0_g1_i1.p2  ORF type:complete len:204 (+),score=53.30 gnl/Spiro4/13403_TR7145_c0_g1_i1:33-614(+)
MKAFVVFSLLLLQAVFALRASQLPPPPDIPGSGSGSSSSDGSGTGVSLFSAPAQWSPPADSWEEIPNHLQFVKEAVRAAMPVIQNTTNWVNASHVRTNKAWRQYAPGLYIRMLLDLLIPGGDDNADVLKRGDVLVYRHSTGRYVFDKITEVPLGPPFAEATPAPSMMNSASDGTTPAGLPVPPAPPVLPAPGQ